MTFEEYEKFLAEIDENDQEKVLLIDFISLGGFKGYDEKVELKMHELELVKYFFRLAIPFNLHCHFVKRYKVSKPCTLLAVSVKDSNKYLAYEHN